MDSGLPGFGALFVQFATYQVGERPDLGATGIRNRRRRRGARFEQPLSGRLAHSLCLRKMAPEIRVFGTQHTSSHELEQPVDCYLGIGGPRFRVDQFPVIGADSERPFPVCGDCRLQEGERQNPFP
ncbi:hypothetical protein [Dongia sp.]|uniref:hypothetical protein n=1 Tax=Dongia sp. TaxID=1977262 RepID=UPI0034A1449A